VFYAIYDGNANIEAYLDSNGQTAAIYQYDAFGNVLSGAGKGDAIEQAKFSHRFSTKYQDLETGLLYYGYRYTATLLGRWLNRDPIEERGGVNLYGFVGNRGCGVVDILGLEEYKKKVFLLGRDQSYTPPEQGHGTSKPPQNWVDLVKAAENAGYQVIPNATATQVRDAAKVAEEMVYYNHGFPTGNIQVEVPNPNPELTGPRRHLPFNAPLQKLLVPGKIQAKRVLIVCCHYDKVVNAEVKAAYHQHGITIKSLDVRQVRNNTDYADGAILKDEAVEALTKYFKVCADNIKH
jgi:RHS repeat-associated protein